MWKDLLLILNSVWQNHTAAITLFKSDVAMGKAFLILLLGSSVGVVLLYFFPDMVRIIIKGAWLLCRKGTRTVGLNGFNDGKGKKEKKEHWIRKFNRNHEQAVKKLSHWIKESPYPKAIIFVVTAIPVPGFEMSAILAVKLMNLRSGFGIIFTANILRNWILVLIVYKIGALFSSG